MSLYLLFQKINHFKYGHIHYIFIKICENKHLTNAYICTKIFISHLVTTCPTINNCILRWDIKANIYISFN